MTTLTALTPAQTKRVNNEIRETRLSLNNELSFPEDLQKSDIIKFLTSHITHLNNMLVNGWEAPNFN